MMLGKVETRPANIPRDGRHCDLCGCSQPAVRCDKCGCQIFCLSCDDMYHRHPKRRFHLRKAVDPTPPTSQARPVLPMKVAHMATSPGDPSKMPLPPPRKKKPTKSFFDTFRRRSPSADNSPPLPKKEYSWTDRLGNIKKFMSNRPLPPVPTNGVDENDLIENAPSTKNDLSFIHKRVDDKPPQLPQRSLKPTEFSRAVQEKENTPAGMPGHMGSDIRNGNHNSSQINHSQEFNRSPENQWNNNSMGNHQANTLNRQFPPGHPGFPGSNMHQSTSATDLPNLPGMDGHPGMPPMHYPHYPMNPHLPPHYPYPMYPPPQFPNYPQYFGNSFANLSSQPTTTDGDFSDQSESSSRHPGRKYPFRKRAKRSQSVLVDRMQYPGQFFPFGPFPPGYGPGPWGAPFPMETPPSPASSVRSLNRVGRTRRRKKLTSEDDDEEFSMSSPPMSRPKSSSSERPLPAQKPPSKPPKSSSSDERESDEEDRRSGRNDRKDRTLRRNSDPRRLPSPVPKSPQVVHKKISKQKQPETLKHSDAEIIQTSISKLERGPSRQSNQSKYSDAEDVPSSPARMDRRSSRDSNADPTEKVASAWIPSSSWHCNHCTFINPAGNRICQVCCKTATTEESTLVASRPNSAGASTGSRKQSLSSEKSCSSPEKRLEEEEDSKTSKETQDMAVLNTALDEAEKEITRGLEELMKLKEDFKFTKSEEKSIPSSPNKPPTIPEASSSKPVYKSSGKLRTSILDKIIPPNKQSTSTETQTGGSSKTDRIVEARRPSTSSTTSDAYNSPTAQSPQLERTDMGRNSQKGVINKSSTRKEMSCQTQPDELMDYYDKKSVEEEAFLGNSRYGPRYGDRMDNVQSPTSFMYDRGYGMMNRSHSRQSLFTGRMNDFGPMDYGFGARPMYRSVSRSSLSGDYPDGRLSEFSNLRKPEYYLSMEELVERRRQEAIRVQGLELVRMIREAEQQGFTADDIQVALNNCGKQNPLEWLQENWKIMVDNVIALSTSYANDKKENDIGTVSENEAREALRLHKGHIWASVTECVETRQRKFLELKARGKFSSKDITDALTASQGDVELAYAKLTKSTSKPFLMRIWGAGEGAQNKDGALPKPSESIRSHVETYQKDYIDAEDVQSDGLWDEEEEEDVEWDEDYDEPEDEDETEDINLQTCRDDIFVNSDITTPDSDRSDYCDAFGTNTLERNVSSPGSDTFFVIPDTKQAKKSNGLLSKLAALRKEGKESKKSTSKFYDEELEPTSDTQEDIEEEEEQKSYNPLNVIKNTFSAIRDTVSGSSKSEKKLPCAAPEKRTIIVRGQIAHESLKNDENGNDEKTNSANSLKNGSSNIRELPGKETGAIPKHSLVNAARKSTEISKEMEIQKNLADTDNTVKEIRSAMEAESLHDSAGSKSPLSKSPTHKVTEINEVKKLAEDSNLTETNYIYDEKLSPKNNSTFLKKEPPTEDRKSPSPKFEKVNSSINDGDKKMANDSKSNSNQINKNAVSTLKEKHILEATDRNKEIPNLAEHPPVFSTVKNNKTSLKKKSDELDKTKYFTNQKLDVKKNEITEAQKKPEENAGYVDKKETKNYIPYIDSSISVDATAKISNKASTSNDGNNLKEISMKNEGERIESPRNNNEKTNIENLSGNLSPIVQDERPSDRKQEATSFTPKDELNKAVDPNKPPNEPKLMQTGQASSSIEPNQTSKDLKQFKTDKSEESIEKVFEPQNVLVSGTFENGLEILTEKVNQQDNKTVNHSTSEQTYNLKDSSVSIKAAENNQKHKQEVNQDPILKLNEENEIQLSHDEIEASSNKEQNEVRESKKSSPKSPLLSSQANDPLMNSDLPVVKQPLGRRDTDTAIQHSDETSKIQINYPKEALASSANESIRDLTIIKASSSQITENKLKSHLNERSLGPSEASNSIKDEKMSIKLVEDETSKSPTPLNETKEKQKIYAGDKKSADPEKYSKIEAPISLKEPKNVGANISSSNEGLALPLEYDESTKGKSSSSDTSSFPLKHSKSDDFLEPLNSSSSGKVLNIKSGKKKPTEDELPSPVKLSVSQSTEGFSAASSKMPKNETHVSEIYNKSQITCPESNEQSISKSPSASKVIPEKSDQSNETTTVVKENLIDSDESQQKVISVDIPSISNALKEISINQSDSTKSGKLDEKSLTSNSLSSDSKDMSTEIAEQINNQHSKETLQENEAKTNNRSYNSDSSATDSQSRSSDSKSSNLQSSSTLTKLETVANSETSINDIDEDEGSESSDNSRQSSLEPSSPVEALRNRFEGLTNGNTGTIRPQSPYRRRMSFRSTKAAIALERTRDTSVEKPWVAAKPTIEQKKPPPKRSIKQQLEIDRKVRKMVADKKVRTYRKAEIVVQLMDLNFEEEEAIQAANECSSLELAISFLQQDCLLCAGKYPVSQMISMVHCPHKACRECIRAYFTVQIRDRNIMELLCPFCNEPDIFDEDIAQDYFNHLDIMLKKLVDPEIHELFQRKLRDRVLMRDPNFRWCSQCSSGFIAMENLTRLVCPDCNAVMCASCRRPWEKEHNGISCKEFAVLKDANDAEAQAAGLAKLLTEDGIDCPMCHFRYQLAKGGCMHFRCTQCQHDFCSGCSRPFKMGQKCGVSEFCAKLGLHAHHPRNCLFYLRDKEPQDLQRLLEISGVKYDREPQEGMDVKRTCQVMEQKETADGMVDDCCGKEVEEGFAGLCRIHYVEYLGQLVNKHKVDPIQIFEVDDLELVLRRANIRLPYKKYRETDDKYRKRLVQLIEEELPLDKMDGS